MENKNTLMHRTRKNAHFCGWGPLYPTFNDLNYLPGLKSFNRLLLWCSLSKQRNRKPLGERVTRKMKVIISPIIFNYNFSQAMWVIWHDCGLQNLAMSTRDAAFWYRWSAIGGYLKNTILVLSSMQNHVDRGFKGWIFVKFTKCLWKSYPLSTQKPVCSWHERWQRCTLQVYKVKQFPNVLNENMESQPEEGNLRKEAWPRPLQSAVSWTESLCPLQIPPLIS